MLDQFFITDLESATILTGTYAPWLVVLSIFLASMASFFALRLAAAARHIKSKHHQNLALLSGSLIMAGGIWSMHFVGMLAFNMPHEMRYDPLLTVVSLLPATLSSYIVLRSLINNNDSLSLTLRNGLIVGSGIGAMHYVGMEAMIMDAVLLFDPFWFALSIVVAVVLAFVALSARRVLRYYFPSLRSFHVKLISAIIMGGAISGMHYTGMEAARFIMLEPHAAHAHLGQSHDQSFLAIGVAIATLLISTLALNVSSQLRYRQLLTEKTASETRLQAILDTATDGVITINAKGVIQGFNGAASRIFGWREAEIIGQNISSLMPNPHRDAHDSYLSRYFETGKENIIGSPREVFAQHKLGHLIPVRLGVGRVDLESGETLFVGFVADISERRSMEEKLRESEERLSSLMQNIPGASFRRKLDKSWTPIFLSDGILEIAGYSSARFFAQQNSFADLVFADDYEKVCHLIETLGEEKNTYAVEYRLKHKSGDLVWVLENGLVVKDQNGKVLWVDGVMIDISSRKEMEDALIQAKRVAEEAAESKAAFLANMSHEIRTPMNAIIGFTDILLDSSISGENRHHLQTIDKASRSLLHLLNDILDSAKLDKNKLDIEPISFNLSACVDTVISTLWLNAKSKGIELALSLSDTLPTIVYGAEDRIRQVLMNLVGNGIKFTESGNVTLTVAPMTEKPGFIRFSIVDTGIGIEQDRLDAIFDAFTQADASMSRRFGGTGLGTTISRQLVELMGGEIHATSTLGKGSEFTFDLPLPESELEATCSRETRIKLPPMRILVCDDIKQNTRLLKILLEREGHSVITAADGVEGVLRYKEEAPELILMDLQMPKLDGLGASREIRAWEQEQGKAAIPIVALTASVLTEDRLQAHNAGMNGFANKPIDMAQLEQEIARVLGLKYVEHAGEDKYAQSQAKSTSTQLIHFEKGLKLWGSEQLYVSELYNLVNQQSDLADRIQTLIHGKHWEELATRAHAMKGLCGNFALLPLHKLFAQLELAADKHCSEQAQTASEEISLHWPKLHDEVEKLYQPFDNQPESQSSNTMDSVQLRRLLTEWLNATKVGELRDDIIESVHKSAPTTVNKSIVDAINAIDEFDFKIAADHLEAALESLEE